MRLLVNGCGSFILQDQAHILLTFFVCKCENFLIAKMLAWSFTPTFIVEPIFYEYVQKKKAGRDDFNADHAVYANAMLYNSSKYTTKASAEVEWIKPIEEYDKELEKHDAKSILNN